jgi:hypothetical protein
MFKDKGGIIVAALVALLFSGGAYLWRASEQPLPEVGVPAAAAAGNAKIARIGLERLSEERPLVELGRRNPFKEKPTAPPTPPPTPTRDPNAPTPTDTPPPPPPPTPTDPPPPPIPLKYIGLVEPGSKKKVAVLLSDQKEILHGREGDVVAGRYRIVKIGIESIDIEDMTVSNTQRIPLRGN